MLATQTTPNTPNMLNMPRTTAINAESKIVLVVDHEMEMR